MSTSQAPLYLPGHPLFAQLFKNAGVYRKKTFTMLRLPEPSELGTELHTYVKDSNGSLRVESSATIESKFAIARNPLKIADTREGAIYNEWLIPFDVVSANYGRDALDSLSVTFQPHRKLLTIQAILLTTDICIQLGGDGQALTLQLDNDIQMTVQVGDYLTSKGHGISAHNMTEYLLCE